MRTLNQTTVMNDIQVDLNDRGVVVGTVEQIAYCSYAIMRAFAAALEKAKAVKEGIRVIA